MQQYKEKHMKHLNRTLEVRPLSTDQEQHVGMEARWPVSWRYRVLAASAGLKGGCGFSAPLKTKQ